MRLAAALVVLLFAGGPMPSPEHVQCMGHATQVFASSAQDDPKPWMHGSVEAGCNRSGEQPAGDTNAEWKACSCHHTPKPGGSCDDETQGRTWDLKCQTRCSPKHCQCAPNPCSQTN